MASAGSIAARRLEAETALTKNVQEISRALGIEVVRLPVNARQPELQHVQRLEMLKDWSQNVLDVIAGDVEPLPEGTEGDVGDVVSEGTEEANTPPAEFVIEEVPSSDQDTEPTPDEKPLEGAGDPARGAAEEIIDPLTPPSAPPAPKKSSLLKPKEGK
jgi:hypothetical protein